eukprot:TRINITY_DN10481_c0_g4_i3.p1 TRINITY_DN10481_c0_g4~~TRINITY_DN10481_c0_g4_i3.p1  ORF type:complete len:201 (-),score=44.10 TRINITY_DN10481_c0_g4_i3:276-878(-)
MSEYDEYIPMVDKAVDNGWVGRSNTQNITAPTVATLSADAEKMSSGFFMQIAAFFMALIMNVATVFRNVAFDTEKRGTKGNKMNASCSSVTIYDYDNASNSKSQHPMPACEFSEKDVLPTVLRRLQALEGKVADLNAKPPQMPPEKEEALNNAVSRISTLETELEATKKALHEALAKQGELMEIIDRLKEAKFHKRRFCW